MFRLSVQHEFREKGRILSSESRLIGIAIENRTTDFSAIKDKFFSMQGGRYVFVGCCSATIELVIFQTLYWLTDYVVVPNMIALTCAMTFNFLMSRHYSFNSNCHIARSLILYLLLYLFNMTFTSWFVRFLIVNLGFYSPIAKICGILCVTCWNFPLYRKVIFVQRPEEGQPEK